MAKLTISHELADRIENALLDALTLMMPPKERKELMDVLVELKSAKAMEREQTSEDD